MHKALVMCIVGGFLLLCVGAQLFSVNQPAVSKTEIVADSQA